MEEIKFIHKVSKGSRFNQIYIPSEKEEKFEPGDLVEVRLLEKSVQIYYSKNLPKLTEFKKKLIEEIFKFLMKYKEINQIFIFGSFLIKKIDYKDIDILILTEEGDYFGSGLYKDLIDKFSLKFHLISFNEQRLRELLKICPLTRSMFYYYVSNKEFKVPAKTEVNHNHIRFLLMMPEDLLEVNLNYGEEYYNALRKLYVIENFLIGQEIPPNKIDIQIEEITGQRKLDLLRRNEILDEEILEEMKKIIKKKIGKIYHKINYGKEK